MLTHRAFRLLSVLLFLCFACVVPLRAQDLSTALYGFTKDSFNETEKAINAVAASGDPRAADILSALQQERLLFQADPKGVYVKDASGTLSVAATGGKADVDPAALKPVRLKNSLRRTVEAALGGLTLLSKDPTKRFEAAQAVFKSRDVSALPALETAIAKETDANVASALKEAQASVLLQKSDATDPQRLDAISVLKSRGDQDALALLTTASSSLQGLAKTVAASAAASVQTRLSLWANAQNVWYGLSLGSVLLLAAIGLAITFGVMGVINMAHGEMVMIGAYTTFTVQEWIRNHDPALFDYSLLIAVPLAFVVAGAVGMLIERLVIRSLYGRPLDTLLATWGVSLILQQAVRTIFGADNRDVGAPSWMSGSFHLGGLEITSGRMWIIVFTVFVFVALQLVLRATPFGLRMRAVTQNRRMASAMGIDTGRVDMMAFGLGSAIAGIAGVALSQIDNVSPNLGQNYIIDSFMVVVFGGVGNLWGTLVAALSLGIANKFLEPFAGAVLGKILLLVFIILFIQKRPRGLFALKGRMVEQ
ncbi:urea ABC transporter permease subunit UrtB [Methylovirgula sp. 4M-Z18]|uniref:urea ABC transporter permease subunit UrtB n=1 Tax=Methylovirgula sp. 4M-Z18 TaxID=2293567 RepID=UPI000E2F4372|nr:urea ABC transporter permease subunit UrtB [Methylovirgula sp. 4M-Z18]RFB79189.1 urea ABC transporter permease subunit UrtB [Methylovirgula sp. 4M-Z18]